MGARADFPCIIPRAHLEGELPPLHSGQARFGINMHADRRCRCVADIQARSDSGFSLLQERCDTRARGLLHQGDHRGSRKYGQGTAAHGGGSSRFGDQDNGLGNSPNVHA